MRKTDGWTALHWAARNGHLRCVELLLEYGARIGWLDSEGMTALESAGLGKHKGVVDVLVRRKGERVEESGDNNLLIVISFPGGSGDEEAVV